MQTKSIQIEIKKEPKRGKIMNNSFKYCLHRIPNGKKGLLPRANEKKAKTLSRYISEQKSKVKSNTSIVQDAERENHRIAIPFDIFTFHLIVSIPVTRMIGRDALVTMEFIVPSALG